MARLRDVEARQTGIREEQVAATERFNRVQSEFYARAGDISRLEQAIKHNEEREQALRGDRADAQGTLDELERVMATDRDRLADVSARLTAVEPRLETSKTEETRAADALRAAEQGMVQWQSEWDTFNREHNTLAQTEHAARIRLEHLLRSTSDHDKRQQTLHDEAERNATQELEARAAAQREDVARLDATRAELGTRRAAIRQDIEQAQASSQALLQTVHDQQVRLEEQRGRLASLRALQEAAYGDDQEAVEHWARAHGITDVRRLADCIQIEPGWEAALEAALRIPLGALGGAGLVARLLDGAHADLARVQVTVIDTTHEVVPPPGAGSLLASKVRGAVDLAPLLHEIHVAPDEAAARCSRNCRRRRWSLPNGTLLGHHWVRLPGQGTRRRAYWSGPRADDAGGRHRTTGAATTRVREDLTGARTRVQELELEDRRL